MANRDKLTEANKAAAEMVRVVRMLVAMIEDGVDMDGKYEARVADAISGFLVLQPEKVRDEVLHG